MKQETIAWTFRAGVAALAFAAPLVARAASSTPAQSATPCTYVGRLMDAEHVGFDTNRVAEIAAYDASGNLVATSKTFYKANSRRNYALRIPMASKAVGGALTPDSPVTIEVTTPDGAVWSGVVVDQDAIIGGPGSVKEVDMVLAECTNPYDIDDELLRSLRSAWRYSEYYVAGETFDPRKDYDGDGMSTIGEALTGTDPFDPPARRTSWPSRAVPGGPTILRSPTRWRIPTGSPRRSRWTNRGIRSTTSPSRRPAPASPRPRSTSCPRPARRRSSASRPTSALGGAGNSWYTRRR